MSWKEVLRTKGNSSLDIKHFVEENDNFIEFYFVILKSIFVVIEFIFLRNLVSVVFCPFFQSRRGHHRLHPDRNFQSQKSHPLATISRHLSQLLTYQAIFTSSWSTKRALNLSSSPQI